MSRLPDDGDRLDRLPVRSLPAGTHWLRIAAQRFPSPLYFNRMPGGRFNPRSGRFGTLYLAETVVGAVAESICRGAAQRPADGRAVSETYLCKRSLYRIEIRDALQVADFSLPQLARFRLDARIYAEYDADGSHEYHHGKSPLITTAEGRQRAELTLLDRDPEQRMFHRLCEDYGLDAGAIRYGHSAFPLVSTPSP